MIKTPVCTDCVYLSAPYLRSRKILKYNIYHPNICLFLSVLRPPQCNTSTSTGPIYIKYFILQNV